MKVGDYLPCKICGMSFKTTHNAQRICSRSCRLENQRIKNKKYYDDNHQEELDRHKAYRSLPEVKVRRQEYMKEYASTGKLKKAKKKYIEKNPQRRIIEKLEKYNLTPEDYDNLMASQNDVCAICKRPETNKHQNGKVKQLAVDHCHKTDKVRGLLCFSCNLALGKFEDSTERLETAISYLNRNKANRNG